MRLITLVRHAKSSWDYPELSDFERPLNDRGRRAAPAMARRAKELLGAPDRLVSSPALRAITTAHVFAEALAIDANDIVIQPSIYEASADTLLRIVRALDDRDRHVMLFGHNPGFTDLAHELARCPFEDLPTCAVAELELGIKTWRDVRHGVGKVRRYLFPKQVLP